MVANPKECGRRGKSFYRALAAVFSLSEKGGIVMCIKHRHGFGVCCTLGPCIFDEHRNLAADQVETRSSNISVGCPSATAWTPVVNDLSSCWQARPRMADTPGIFKVPKRCLQKLAVYLI